jgi:hypothetical protein
MIKRMTDNTPRAITMGGNLAGVGIGPSTLTGSELGASVLLAAGTLTSVVAGLETGALGMVAQNYTKTLPSCMGYNPI